ncbi:MAG: PorV/PorQ family protein [Ignavibacteriaceae bacterium]|nr:PorV/PorQ family protein [Ignavibacteriaceae bacterium]
MKKILMLMAAMSFCSLLFAQTKVGTTAANFLTIPVGPRASAMGSAFLAVANDATTAYWNPGGLSRLSRNEFTASFSEWLVNTKINWFGVAFKFDENNAIAISINQLDYGQEEITTAEQPNGTGARWDAVDLAVGVSYSRNLTDRFSIGATGKYITQRIWNESASAFALDIGLLFYTQLEGLQLGMNISNFGTELKLDGKDLLQSIDVDPSNAGNNANIAGGLNTESWPLPLTFSVGLAYDAINSEDWVLTLASDAVIPNNQSTYGNFGGEITWNKIISLRGGLNSVGKEAAEEGYTVGAGVQYDFGGFFAKIDYSYSDFGIFKQIQRFAISVGL